VTKPFSNNQTVKGMIFQPDDRKPTHNDEEWDATLASHNPKPLPPAGSTVSAIPGGRLPTRTGNEDQVY